MLSLILDKVINTLLGMLIKYALKYYKRIQWENELNKDIDDKLEKLKQKKEEFKKSLDEAIDGKPVTKEQEQKLIEAARDLIHYRSRP